MGDRRPLISESSDLSDTTNDTPVLPSLGFISKSHCLEYRSPPAVPPPTSPRKVSRPGYSRLRSDGTALEGSTPETLHEEDEEDIGDTLGRMGSGLGIGSPTSLPPSDRRVSIQAIPRAPAGAKSPPIKSPSFASPLSTGDPRYSSFPRDSLDNTPDLRRERFSPHDERTDYEDFRRGILKNARNIEGSPRATGDYQRYLEGSDTQRLRPGAPSIRSAYESDFRPTQECPTAKDFYQPRYTWISVTVIILCLFSTVFSGIFLGIAWKGPRYGRRVTTHGSLSPSSAILLTSIMAKLIELSFVTSFVAFLGQVLSRRAFMKDQGIGVTLSEMSMWRWVVQPGTLITHWETARYAGLSILGMLSLLSAGLATLYSPAASALVQPQLKFGKWDNMLMAGQVKASFSNVDYVRSICQTPIRTDTEQNTGNTCLQIEHAAQGYHNYQRYLSNWAATANAGNGTSDQKRRPPGFGLLHENTTVTAQWTSVINTTDVSKKYKRAINNVSLAMPHSGVFQAARDQRNGIIQPDDLDSIGTYSLRASVPSPVMHVLCANMDAKELEPIIYDTWNDHELVNISTWSTLWNNATTTNNTVVDDLFGWTKKDKENLLDYPPVFARYPGEYNTIMNHTNWKYGRDVIYLLGQGGPDAKQNMAGQYLLCQIKVSITPYCSTLYNATGGGGSLEALCENEDDKFAYSHSQPQAREVTHLPDWRDIGSEWANSMSLNTGIMDANASNSRLLTQLILQPKGDAEGGEPEYELNPALPSPAEALSVMAGCTLLMASQDTPFVPEWNYTLPILKEPQTQYFNGSLLAQQYASGGTNAASRGFLVVLLLVFLLNIFVLTYFLLHRGLVTDFCEPPNLFALAVNSPPSHLLAGSCGGGPEGKQFVVNWFVNTEGDHLYMEPGQKEYDPLHAHTHMHKHTQASQKVAKGGTGILSAISGGIEKLRQRKRGFGGANQKGLLRPVSFVEPGYEMEEGGVQGERSRAQTMYAKLAKRRSML